MAEEVKAGNYFNLPTMGEVESFYATKKSWWSKPSLPWEFTRIWTSTTRC
jgi:hypothetical protein